MKKAVVIFILLVGTTMIVTAYGRGNGKGYTESVNIKNNDERLRQNAVDPEDCQFEGDEVGTGYLDDENRQYLNQNNTGRGRNRR